jgi:ABC-2 type transport system permease protein
MTATTLDTQRSTPTPSLKFGRTISLGFGRIRYEVRSYFRQTDTIFFTFLFPLMLMLIFSVAFSHGNFGKDSSGHAVTAAEYYLPAMLAAGVLLSGLQNMSIGIAGEKSDGTLKRLGGSPLPMFSYFIGKIGQVVVTSILQAALLIAVAGLFFGVRLPSDPERWWTFAWVLLLGVSTCAILGIALSAVPRSGRSAVAVILPITLILQFISGVYLQFSVMPTWLQNFASFFPLKWLAQGMRYVFLPDSYKTLEQGHSWDLQGILIATLIWLVVGLILCRVTFKWIRKDS